MTGYIVKHKRKGYYLSKRLYWYPHETDAAAWVHDKSIVDKLTLHKAFNLKELEFIETAIPTKDSI